MRGSVGPQAFSGEKSKRCSPQAERPGGTPKAWQNWAMWRLVSTKLGQCRSQTPPPQTRAQQLWGGRQDCVQSSSTRLLPPPLLTLLLDFLPTLKGTRDRRPREALLELNSLTWSRPSCLHGKEKVKPRGRLCPLRPCLFWKSTMQSTIWSKSCRRGHVRGWTLSHLLHL